MCVCPFCGSKEAFKYPSSKGGMFLCHDCQRNISVQSLPEEDKQVIQTQVTYNSLLKLCTKVIDLGPDRYVVQYVKSRRIPQKHWDKLYFTERFQEIADTVGKKVDNGPRLIIPFFNREGNMFAMQGRALDQSAIRYVTLVFDKQEDLLFGQDRVDMNKPFVVVEGPIDSLFLENAVATAGTGNLADKYVSTATICLDNEPRNRDIVRITKKYIDRGFKVVIWSDKNPHKDINDMILNGIDVQSEIEKCTFKGIEGLMKFNIWKKV